MSSAGRDLGIKDRVQAGLKVRYRREQRFRLLGFGAVLVGAGFLAFFFATLIANGYSALRQTHLLLDVVFDEQALDPTETRDPETLASGNYNGLARDSLRAYFPEVTERRPRRALGRLLSPGAAFQLREMVLADPGLIGTTQSVWLLADDDVDMLVKGHIDRDLPASERRIDGPLSRPAGGVGAGGGRPCGVALQYPLLHLG